jgi:hypothetical protein
MTRLLLLAAFFDLALTGPRTTEGLIAHEWGTFTQVSGDDGVAVDWRPLIGPKELPGFVYDDALHLRGIGDADRDANDWARGGKGHMSGTVRMETPVIYFYSKRELDVSVRVDFPGGRITEFYPAAKAVDAHGIDWGRFKLMPPDFRVPLVREPRGSHYYAARDTDASIVRVCGAKTEYEKFLFYRGVGTFKLPLAARLDGRRVHLSGAVGRAIVYERHGARAGYRVVDVGAGGVDVERPDGGGSVRGVMDELYALLVDAGLYSKEAQAMLATWRDDWFEDGLRVFYLLPERDTAAALPLAIEPAPAALVRVMVGRAEIITPEMEQAVLDTLNGMGDLTQYDYDAIAKRLQSRYGRFAEPIFKRLVSRARTPAEREHIALYARALGARFQTAFKFSPTTGSAAGKSKHTSGCSVTVSEPCMSSAIQRAAARLESSPSDDSSLADKSSSVLPRGGRENAQRRRTRPSFRSADHVPPPMRSLSTLMLRKMRRRSRESANTASVPSWPPPTAPSARSRRSSAIVSTLGS